MVFTPSEPPTTTLVWSVYSSSGYLSGSTMYDVANLSRVSTLSRTILYGFGSPYTVKLIRLFTTEDAMYIGWSVSLVRMLYRVGHKARKQQSVVQRRGYLTHASPYAVGIVTVKYDFAGFVPVGFRSGAHRLVEGESFADAHRNAVESACRQSDVVTAIGTAAAEGRIETSAAYRVAFEVFRRHRLVRYDRQIDRYAIAPRFERRVEQLGNIYRRSVPSVSVREAVFVKSDGRVLSVAVDVVKVTEYAVEIG